MAGHSGTPLARQLGIETGDRVGLINAPDGFAELVEPLPEGAELLAGVRSRRDVVVAFLRERGELESKLTAMTKAIFPDGAMWIAWPKRAAKMPATITEDVVREVALATGLVSDTGTGEERVCLIDDTWAGLRLVVRHENRR